ncbi:MAG: MSMEG_1061 family FMN-dependent PPOX-type flavoprotein [Pseudomonadota bacterium]
MVEVIEDIAALEALYGIVSEPAKVKVARMMTPAYRRWIMASRYCILSTVGPEGADGSPRGDDGPVVRELDERTLAMPDWRGNNRIDSLRNIVRDGRAALMFMVPGVDIVVRVNARARLTADPALCETFEQRGKHPRTVILFDIDEIYAQCPKAMLRSSLWGVERVEGLPTLGEMLKDATSGAYDGDEFDRTYVPDDQVKMW